MAVLENAGGERPLAGSARPGVAVLYRDANFGGGGRRWRLGTPEFRRRGRLVCSVRRSTGVAAPSTSRVAGRSADVAHLRPCDPALAGCARRTRVLDRGRPSAPPRDSHGRPDGRHLTADASRRRDRSGGYRKVVVRARSCAPAPSAQPVRPRCRCCRRCRRCRATSRSVCACSGLCANARVRCPGGRSGGGRADPRDRWLGGYLVHRSGTVGRVLCLGRLGRRVVRLGAFGASARRRTADDRANAPVAGRGCRNALTVAGRGVGVVRIAGGTSRWPSLVDPRSAGRPRRRLGLVGDRQRKAGGARSLGRLRRGATGAFVTGASPSSRRRGAVGGRAGVAGGVSLRG